MSKTSCILYPEAPNGENSKMYKGILNIVKSRPLTNWFYAAYTASNAGDAMVNAGIARNSQGEHNAEDVLRFFDWKTMQSEMSNLAMAELQLGAVDTNGQRIDYTDAKEALKKCDDFNDAHKGLVATVVQHGNVYNIIVAEKNSRTHTYGQLVKEKLQIWNVYKQAFNAIGVDIENMPQELASTFSAYRTDLADYLRNLQNLQMNYFYRKDALTLFYLDANSPQVQRLVGSFGKNSIGKSHQCSQADARTGSECS